ncbi:MAG TPA: ABC transporter permease, partial [Terriglobales bacterium]|nr:ABC transporter permease [Terriglobales bacterium]
MGPSAVMTQSPTSQSRLVSLIESFVRDLKFTVRSLRRKPGFTLVVVLSLALGIGANTAIFSVVDAVLLRPLPIPHAKELITVDVAASRDLPFGSSSYLDLQDFRQRSRAFESLAIDQNISAGLSTGQGEPQVIYGLMVSSSFLHVMQVQPSLGRDFRADEDEVPGKYPVAIISDALWGRAFANDPGIVGRQVKLNGKVFNIIGVTPKSFSGPNL